MNKNAFTENQQFKGGKVVTKNEKVVTGAVNPLRNNNQLVVLKGGKVVTIL